MEEHVMVSLRRFAAAILTVCLPATAVAVEPNPRSDLYGDGLPPGATARLGTLRFRAAGPVGHLAYSPDGKQLVAQSHDAVSLWDTETGRKLAEFSGHKVGPLAWRPDGRGVMLVTEAGGRERIGDFTRERLKPLPPKEYYEQLRTPGNAAQRDDEEFHGHAISPNGKYLVVGRRGNRDRARAITVWNIELGKPLEEFLVVHDLGPQQGNCHGIVFSPDSKFVGVVSGPKAFNDGTFPEQSKWLLALYDLAVGKEQFRLAIPPPRSVGEHWVVAMAAEARYVAVASHDTMCRVYEWGQKEPVLTIGAGPKRENGSGWNALTFAGDRLFAANGEDQSLHVYELKTGKPLRPAARLDYGIGQGMALSADGKRLAVAGRNGTIRQFDALSGREFEPAAGHFGGITGLQVFAQGRKALTWGEGADARLWDLSTGKELQRFSLPRFTGPLSMSPDEKLVLAVSGGKLRLFDAATGDEQAAPGDLATARANALHRAGDGRSIVLGDDASVSIWDWPDGRLRRRIEVEADLKFALRPARTFQLTPNGKLLLSRGLADLTLWDLDVEASKQMTIWNGNAVEREPELLLTVVGDGTRVAFSGRVMGDDEFPGNFGVPAGKAKAPKKAKAAPGGFGPGGVEPPGKKGRGLAVGGFGGQEDGPFGKGGFGGQEIQDGFPGGQGIQGAFGQAGGFMPAQGFGKKKVQIPRAIALWDIRFGKLVRTFQPFDSGATCDLVADPGGFVIASSELDFDGFGNVLLYEVATGGIRRQLPPTNVVTALAFTDDGQRLVTVGHDTAGLVWDMSLMSAARGRKPADDAELEDAWNTLAVPAAAAAYDALLVFASNPERAIDLLRQRLRPIPILNAAKLDQIVADLEDEKFLTREHAANELEKLGRVGLPAMRTRAPKAQSREAKLRLAQYLERYETSKLLPDELRTLRALELLEHAATPASRALLAELSAGEPAADVTMRARAAQTRLDWRKK
jgi:WD40 repeat protein